MTIPKSPFYVTIEARKDSNDPVYGHMDRQNMLDSLFDSMDSSKIEEYHIIESGYMDTKRVFFSFNRKSNALEFMRSISKELFNTLIYQQCY